MTETTETLPTPLDVCDTLGANIARALRGTARLLRLAKRLETDNQIKFDMRSWGFHYGTHAPEEENYCGTTACILGVAALMPANEEEGLRHQWMAVDTNKQSLEIFIDLHGEKYYDGRAGEIFYDLTSAEATHLFHNKKIHSKTGAARFLRKLARDRTSLRELRDAGVNFI